MPLIMRALPKAMRGNQKPVIWCVLRCCNFLLLLGGCGKNLGNTIEKWHYEALKPEEGIMSFFEYFGNNMDRRENMQ